MPRTKKETANLKKNELNIDKETIVTEIKDEIKEELLQELTLKIEIEAKNKLEKMEKRIYKYKKTALRKKNIVIIMLLLIIVLETKIIYDNNYLSIYKLNGNLNSSNVSESTTTKEEKDDKWYLDNYSYLLDNVKTNLSGDELTYIYKGNYTESNIKNSIKLNMAYQLLNPKEIISTSNVITIQEESLKTSYRKIFGTIDNYNPENFMHNCLQFIYNQANNSYMAIDITCNSKNIEILEGITTIYEEEGNIIIETIVGLYDNNTKILSDINNNIISEDYDRANKLQDYKANLNSYRYTFQKIANNYYLKSITKLK